MKLLDVKSARELAEICVCAGLASNIAAMRALATEGIQQGHMSLHARQIAMSAGATGALVDLISEQMIRERTIKPVRASELLQEMTNVFV